MPSHNRGILPYGILQHRYITIWHATTEVYYHMAAYNRGILQNMASYKRGIYYHMASYNIGILPYGSLQQRYITIWHPTTKVYYHMTSHNRGILPYGSQQQRYITIWHAKTEVYYHMTAYNRGILPYGMLQQRYIIIWHPTTEVYYNMAAYNSGILPYGSLQQGYITDSLLQKEITIMSSSITIDSWQQKQIVVEWMELIKVAISECGLSMSMLILVTYYMFIEVRWYFHDIKWFGSQFEIHCFVCKQN